MLCPTCCRGQKKNLKVRICFSMLFLFHIALIIKKIYLKKASCNWGQLYKVSQCMTAGLRSTMAAWCFSTGNVILHVSVSCWTAEMLCSIWQVSYDTWLLFSSFFVHPITLSLTKFFFWILYKAKTAVLSNFLISLY